MKLLSFLKIFELLEGSRKFLIMFLIVIVGILFRIHNYIDGANFVDLIKGCFIAFAASNASEHIIKALKVYISGNKKKE